MRRMLLRSLAAGCVGLWPAVAGANPPRGYQERPCGFDLDDDGVVGEPVDDCRICDGSTADPDGDGVDEDLIYVDCAAGSDGGSCGSPSSPCRTVTYALETRMDGPADGAEDIVCFTGTCAPRGVTPAFGGLANTRVIARSGSQARDFELATDPAMLVGWDRDGDGEYPPYDADDVAVLDGAGGERALTFRNSTASHFEIAHFEAMEYGRTGSQGGFFTQGPSHHYLHDLSLQNICREMPTPSGRIVFDFFSSQDNHFFWLKNIECEHCGGYFSRGAGGNGPAEAGPFRFEKISLRMHPCSYGSSPECDAQPYSPVAKLWGYIAGVEFIDSYFDGDPANRSLGAHPSHWPHGVIAANCSRDYVVRNNTFHDVAGMTVQGYAAGFCDGPEARPTDAYLFENNLVEFEALGRPIDGATLNPVGQVAGGNVGAVTVRGNIFRTTAAGGMQSCFTYATGNTADPPTEPLVFEGNRCEGATGAAIRVLAGGAVHHDNYVVSDNVFAGVDDLFISSEYAPAAFASDHNIFGGQGAFRWPGTPSTDLAGFQALTASNANSEHCPDGSCVPPMLCGDGTCDADEDCATCPEDCGEIDDSGGETGDPSGSGGDSDDSDAEGSDAGPGSDTGPTSGSADAGSGAMTDGAAPGSDAGAASGCACRAPAGAPPGSALWGLVLAAAGRRRKI